MLGFVPPGADKTSNIILTIIVVKALVYLLQSQNKQTARENSCTAQLL